VKLQDGGGLDNDGCSEQASGVHQPGTQGSDEALGWPKVRRPLTGAVQHQQLLLEQQGLGDYTPGAPRPTQAEQDGNKVSEEGQEVTHRAGTLPGRRAGAKTGARAGN
jgi:hypothetical protein